MAATLDEQAVMTILDELAASEMTVNRAEELMARLDGLEPLALPIVFRWLHDAADGDAIHAATRLLVRWEATPVAAALPRALRALIREEAPGDLNKIAAAGVLAVLKQPLHEADLAQHLRDPAAVKHSAMRRLLDVSAGRLTIVHVLDALGQRPIDTLLPLIADLADLDESAARVLVPLAHHPVSDVAIAAIAALDGLGAVKAAEALEVVAQNHIDPDVRRQAALTATRLAGGPESAATAGAVVRLAELASGRRVMMLRAPSPMAPGEHELLTLHLDDDLGVVESAMLERIADAALEGLETRLAESGARIETLHHDAARTMLTAATALNLATATEDDRPLGWTAWRELLAPVN